MAIADYQRPWEHLSRDHEIKAEEVQRVLDNYRRDKSLKYMAYAILGTYGVGKTHFLYHIHKYALENEMVPLYFLAEDLFREIITERERTWTPGDLYSLIEDKISKVKTLLASGEVSEIQKIIDPRGKISKDSPDVMNSILGKYSSSIPENPKLILLVDELEGQYGNLQDIVQTKDRSPLREWFESKTHLKFLAFAPAGIYELGGADRDRVRRIVIPSADVRYIRENLIMDAGRANSCWWLSRGKARQLYKTVEILGELEPSYFQDASMASRVIKERLDYIGQPPTQVPPAVTEKIPPLQIPYLLSLAPQTTDKKRRYIINTNDLSTGELAEKIIDAFNITNDNAILIAEYFKKTTLALSDNDGATYISENELPDLFCLALDHFLEYEHGNPDLAKTFGALLGLYERSREEPAAMHGTIGRLWDRSETDKGLLLSIEQIRGAFPFPTMNPIVKDYVPDDMRRKWEGREVPLWKWSENNLSCFFFTSTRDLISYLETDEFLSCCLTDGAGALCILPYGEAVKSSQKTRLHKWLEKNNKLKTITIQHIVSDFLISASGELAEIPGGLTEILKVFREDKEDILLSRKTEVYENALNDIVRDESAKPVIICKKEPPDADTVWGRTQIGFRTIAVNGISVAFASMNQEERILLADLRELFKGGREGKGLGDLRYLISSREAPGQGGHTRLPDRLLPYRARGAGLRNTEHIEKLRTYWSDEERDNLTDLARTVTLEVFLKLHQDENINRILEAVWRTVRDDFDIEGIGGYIAKLEKEIIPTLQVSQELEKTARKFGIQGIDYGNYEHLVKSLGGYEQLLEIVNRADKYSNFVKSILSILLETTNDIDNEIRELDDRCKGLKQVLDDLIVSAEDLSKNLWEYKKAVKYLALDEKKVGQMLQEQLKMDGVPDLDEMEETATSIKDDLNEFSTLLSQLEHKLNELNELFILSRGGK